MNNVPLGVSFKAKLDAVKILCLWETIFTDRDLIYRNFYTNQAWLERFLQSVAFQLFLFTDTG